MGNREMITESYNNVAIALLGMNVSCCLVVVVLEVVVGLWLWMGIDLAFGSLVIIYYKFVHAVQ